MLSLESLKRALDAGATFIVMPTSDKRLVDYCRQNKIPVFPGALTPQEIYAAWENGATMCKVFPAACFGPNYFKYLKGPFSDIALMAVGGVRENNIAEYFACGAQAVAVGESVFNKQQISAGDFQAIAKSLKVLVEKVKSSVG